MTVVPASFPPAGTGSRILDDLAEVIGEEAAFALAWEFRGQRLYVPKDPQVEPLIARAIGEALAAKFCDAFWRTTIYLPMREATRRKVHTLARSGMTRREIARVAKIAERQVYRLLDSPAPPSGSMRRSGDDRQLEML